MLLILSMFSLSTILGVIAPDYNVAHAQGRITTIVSIASDGTQGNDDSWTPSISADGRFVAFSTFAGNLSISDSNGVRDIFVHDRLTDETTRISVASDRTEANSHSRSQRISADGRFVTFQSWATNLVANDMNGTVDIFVHDRATAETTRVSVASNGSQANGGSSLPDISGDGRFITFDSDATNLVGGDTNGVSDIFVHDCLTDETTRISVASDGSQANDESGAPRISDDGRFVTFYSLATNLVVGDTNGIVDIFVHDRVTGETTRVSVASDGTQVNGIAITPEISGDGRFVAFDSWANNLVPGDTNHTGDLYVHDRATGETTRISVASDGTQANDDSDEPRISRDGRFIAFNSDATNLVVGDTNGAVDAFVHDRATGETTRVSVASDGTQANYDTGSPAISAMGQFIAFDSDATNLVSGDNNNRRDIFVYDRVGDGVAYDNLLQNPGFETGTAPWKFWTDAEGSFTTETPGYQGDYAARVDIIKAGENVQLYQKGFLLEPKTYYRLEFSARSNRGHDVAIYLHKHKAPYSTFGLRNFRVNLTDEWNTFDVTFRTKKFDTPTTDTRLRLYLRYYDMDGDIYWFDSFSLTKVERATVAASGVASPATGEIHGNVRIAHSVRPVVMTLVDMESEGLAYRSMARTDASGAYHFPNVPHGFYELQVEPPAGYLPVEPVQLAISDRPNETIDFALDAITTTIYVPYLSR